MILQNKKTKLLSMGMAAILFINMFGSHSISQAPSTAETSQESRSIEISKVNASMNIEAEELFFGVEEYSPVLGACALEDCDDNFTLLMEKIATDYVEPEPEPEANKSNAQARKFNVRTYTAEEIAANKLTPYKTPQSVGSITYYTDNMIDAVATPSCPQFMNDDDVYAMARIIHAEICLLGDEARRCVGTVILNRAWNNGQTFEQVIYAPSQFSTAYTSKVPCDECLAAAYDVIYNNYRSFPHYVDSFQCIRDGYFPNHRTYIAFNDGRFKTYFSYSKRSPIITSFQ